MLANPGLGAHQGETQFLSKAVKHHWYGDRSPWMWRRLEDYYPEGTQVRPATKVVILDRQNPPQLRSAWIVESQD